jgi:hypothetical protein
MALFYPGDEEKIVSIIRALLLDYQQHDELTVENVKNIVQRHKKAKSQEAHDFSSFASRHNDQEQQPARR